MLGRLTALSLLVLTSATIQKGNPNHAGATEEYYYSDDFSTDKAMDDSYLHSPFVDSLPYVYLGGLLIYTYYQGNNRALGFYHGFETWGEPYLYYRFPIEGQLGVITEGTIEFDLRYDCGPFHGYPPLYISYDSLTWHQLDPISVAGHYLYTMSPQDSIRQIFLGFTGGGRYGSSGILLDNLDITLTHEGASG